MAVKDASGRIYSVFDSKSEELIAGRVLLAESFTGRLLGLIGRHAVDPDSGLWLNPCNGIHTLGMRFPIDVIILGREGEVLGIHAAVKPNRIIFPTNGGASVLELPVGASHGINTGSRLRFDPAKPED